MHGLFCPDTLRLALRSQGEPDISSREGLKELLSLGQAPEESLLEDFSRWERCLEILVEEFLQRKLEILRLNKARRDQIESFIQQESKQNLTLAEVLNGRVGSGAHDALLLFGHQLCVFNLLQILLVKRWADKSLLPSDCFLKGDQTLNYTITTFIRKHSSKGLLEKHDWSFIKANLFSWFLPTKESWERLRLLLEPVNLSLEAEDFPARILNAFGSRSRLALTGMSPDLVNSFSIWQLLLEQRSLDQGLKSALDLQLNPETQGPILVSGLRNGESLSALRKLSGQTAVQGTWAFTDSEFERYLSEIGLLWNSDAGIPRMNLHSRQLLKELTKDAVKAASLFHNSARVPYQAQLAACFSGEQSQELDDANHLLDQLRENGLLVLASNSFWPTEASIASEKMRDSVLRKASLRLVIDLRHLSGNGHCPKGICILEKCSSKEIRDSNRPQILRLRGHIRSDQFSEIWKAVLEQIHQGFSPGEVVSKGFPQLGDSVRLEAMGAAANQQELRSSPWITLSDPAFYEASARLKRLPNRAFTFSSMFKWKEGVSTVQRKAIFVQEQAKCLVAALPEQQASELKGEGIRFFISPEPSVAEHPAFFVAQILSAPVQFWYRLELEQSFGRSQKQIDRQSEQRLKLMPLMRIFEAGALLPVQAEPQENFSSLENLKTELTAIFRQTSLGMLERTKLHQIILNLESSVRQSLAVCADFSRFLFPELHIERWQIPCSAPEPSPTLALNIFSHLDKSPLLHHPAVHITRLRSAHDFKVTNSQVDELPMGNLAELKVFHGMDAVLKLSGPSLLMKAVHEEIQRRIGRSWREISEKSLFPTDFMSVQTQLKEIVRTLDSHLKSTRDQIACLDQIFCCLFGLSPSFTDESVRLAIRRHLSPEEGRLNLPQTKEQAKPEVLESPIRILQ